MKLSTKYWLAWSFTWVIFVFILDELSAGYLIILGILGLLLSYGSLAHGILLEKEKKPRAEIVLEKPRGQWDR